MQTCAVIPIDDPSPIAFDNLYDNGDRWVKIQGCEACKPEIAQRCCGNCNFRGDFGCLLHVERGPWKSKPYHCTVLPVPTTCKGDCALIYECIAGAKKGKRRYVTDLRDVLRDG